MKLKSTANNNYKITKDNEFLYHLSISNKTSPIAQIIQGNHRTDAIKKYAARKREARGSLLAIQSSNSMYIYYFYFYF